MSKYTLRYTQRGRDVVIEAMSDEDVWNKYNFHSLFSKNIEVTNCNTGEKSLPPLLSVIDGIVERSKEKSIETLKRRITTLLNSEAYGTLNDYIGNLNVKYMLAVEVLILLVMTRDVKQNLPERERFVRHITEWAIRKYGESKAAKFLDDKI